MERGGKETINIIVGEERKILVTYKQYDCLLKEQQGRTKVFLSN